MSAFSDGMDAIYGDDNVAVDAIYRPGGAGDGVPVRAIKTDTEDTASYGRSAVILTGVMIQVRKSEVQTAGKGDTFRIGTTTYFVHADPRLDPLELEWSCEVKPVT